MFSGRIALDYTPPYSYTSVSAAGPRGLVFECLSGKTVSLYVERITSIVLTVHVSFTNTGSCSVEVTKMSGEKVGVVQATWNTLLKDIEEELLGGWTPLERQMVKWIIEGQAHALRLPKRMRLGTWWEQHTGERPMKRPCLG